MINLHNNAQANRVQLHRILCAQNISKKRGRRRRRGGGSRWMRRQFMCGKVYIMARWRPKTIEFVRQFIAKAHTLHVVNSKMFSLRCIRCCCCWMFLLVPSLAPSLPPQYHRQMVTYIINCRKMPIFVSLPWTDFEIVLICVRLRSSTPLRQCENLILNYANVLCAHLLKWNFPREIRFCKTIIIPCYSIIIIAAAVPVAVSYFLIHLPIEFIECVPRK